MDSAPKKKGKLRWVVLFVLTGTVDLVQLIITFTGVGIAVSEILELIMPFALIGLLLLFKISIIRHPKRIASIIGVTLGDAFTAGIAPFWILDVWYLYSDVKREEAKLSEQSERNAMLQGAVRQPLYRDGSRQPQSGQAPAPIRINKGGIRAPSGGLMRK